MVANRQVIVAFATIATANFEPCNELICDAFEFEKKYGKYTFNILRNGAKTLKSTMTVDF